jgi:hypothetical protein
MNKQIKKGNLNFDQSGRAYPDNPQIKENWDCIWENDGRYYELIGDTEHKEWEQVKVEVRELSMEERLKLWDTRFGFSNEQQKNQFNTDVHLNTHGIPTRAISLTYNNQTEVIYEV